MLKSLVAAAVVIAVIAASYNPVRSRWKERNRPEWRTAQVSPGSIVSVVNATGTIQPVLLVTVGSFVSGPISELHADFNDIVKKGDLLAKVDPRLFDANVARDRAVLANREAEVQRVQALLQQAERDEKRANALAAENEDYISQREMDGIHYNTLSLEAQLKVSNAAVEQAQAALDNSQANLAYTDIISPVDGRVIDRKIDEGQTLAAQFQAPELFIVAPGMEEKMHVFANVDEADIGLIRQAQEAQLPVEFRVDAYPDDLFEGEIEEIRLSSTTTQNVVTYPVVVAAANPELKLLPGMTASISFTVDQRDKVLRIPNSALRFFPESKHVRAEDRPLVEGRQEEMESQDETSWLLSAAEEADTRRKRNQRHVWVNDGDFLRAVEIEVGLSDSKMSELVAGDLNEGAELVTRLKR